MCDERVDASLPQCGTTAGGGEVGKLVIILCDYYYYQIDDDAWGENKAGGLIGVHWLHGCPCV